MEKISHFFKRWAFIEGLTVGALLCHLFYHEFRIDEIKEKYEAKEQASEARIQVKETELQGLKEKVSKEQEYEQKFVLENTRSALAERKFSEAMIDLQCATNRYNNLLAARWEEKYNAEKLARVAADEELVVLRKRLSNAESGLRTADPLLVKQSETLTEQIKILQKERDELKALYLNTPKVNTTAATTPFPVNALAGVGILDIGGTVISIVKSIKKPVDVETFIQALSKVAITERGDVVKSCASALNYPLTEEQLKKISQLVGVMESGEAMKCLLAEQANHQQ